MSENPPLCFLHKLAFIYYLVIATAKMKVSGSNCVQGPWIKGEGNGHCRDVRTEPGSGGWSSAALWPYCLSTAEEWGSSGPAGVLFAGGNSRGLVKPFFTKGVQ